MKKVIGYVVKDPNPAAGLQYLSDEGWFGGRGIRHVFATSQQAHEAYVKFSGSLFPGTKVLAIVLKPKVKPGTVGYVVRAGKNGEYCDTLQWRGIGPDHAPSVRKVFATREEAEAICKGRGLRLVFAVVRREAKPKPPRVLGYAVRFDHDPIDLECSSCESLGRYYDNRDGLSKTPVLMSRAKARESAERKGKKGGARRYGCVVVRIVSRTVGYAVAFYNGDKREAGKPWRGAESIGAHQSISAKPQIMTKEQAKAVVAGAPFAGTSGRKIVRIVSKRPA